jgi:aryl-alcohol dehydrogenase-like predicted oxidoreductase
MSKNALNRRQFLHLASSAALASGLPMNLNAQQPMLTRTIPASGETIPVIGLGTSDAFERPSAEGFNELKNVLQTFIDAGGTMIDTAPTYSDAEQVLGRLFTDMPVQQQLFLATKISLWTVPANSKQAGIDQMNTSEQVLGKAPLDLNQVHNLNDLDIQWQNLIERKQAGKVRYIGVTIYTYRQFERLEAFLRKASGVDFVQLNYSLVEPRAEELLIPLATDKGAAIIVNRPFADGAYFSKVSNKSLPEWAKDFDCESWGQFALKWILGNEAITCAIPATSKSRHMQDNARAGYGRLPDAAQRKQMQQFLQTL